MTAAASAPRHSRKSGAGKSAAGKSAAGSHRRAANKGLHLKRAYDTPAPEDGTRILVDRLWPRGLKKERAKIDIWMKDIAPSPKLRTWFDHDPEKWVAFKRQYWRELADCAAVDELRRVMKKGRVTLVYAARDEKHNHALALSAFLTSRE